MSIRSCAVNVLLADALVELARSSGCVASLIETLTSDDRGPWCLDCPDSEECWAWRAMDVLSCQEIAEAKKRHRTNRWRKWARNGMGRSYDSIMIVERTDRFAA